MRDLDAARMFGRRLKRGEHGLTVVPGEGGEDFLHAIAVVNRQFDRIVFRRLIGASQRRDERQTEGQTGPPCDRNHRFSPGTSQCGYLIMRSGPATSLLEVFRSLRGERLPFPRLGGGSSIWISNTCRLASLEMLA